MRHTIAFCLAVLLSGVAAARSPQNGPFTLGCSTLPFETIKKNRPLDDVCDRASNATNPANQAQNRGKNEFCVPGVAALATAFTFRQLETKTEAAGNTGVPAQTGPPYRTCTPPVRATPSAKAPSSR